MIYLFLVSICNLYNNYVTFTITHAKFNQPSQWCGTTWHCKLPSPQILLCHRHFQWNVIQRRSFFVIAFPLNWIEPYRTILFNVWLRSIAQFFLVRVRLHYGILIPSWPDGWMDGWMMFDYRTQSNPITWLSSTGFNLIRLVERSIWFDWSRRAFLRTKYLANAPR